MRYGRERSRSVVCWYNSVKLYNCVTRNQTMKPNIQSIIIQGSGWARRAAEHNAKCLLSLFSPSDINHKSSRDTSLSQLYYNIILTPGSDKSFRPIQAYSDKCEQK